MSNEVSLWERGSWEREKRQWVTGFLGEREMILGEKSIIQGVIEFLGEKEDLREKKNTMQWVIGLLSQKEDLGRKIVLGKGKSKKWGT